MHREEVFMRARRSHRGLHVGKLRSTLCVLTCFIVCLTLCIPSSRPHQTVDVTTRKVVDGFDSNSSSGAGNSIRNAPACTKTVVSWHLMIVWSHGLNFMDEILVTLRSNVPSIDIPFRKYVTLDAIGPLVDKVYENDAQRIGLNHIKHKTSYLKKLPPKVAVLILRDLAPDFVSYGKSKWKITANRHLVDFKWLIRRKFNPKPKTTSTRDSRGVFSHDHVLHVSDTGEDIDLVSRLLKTPSVNLLARSHDSFYTPWFMTPPKTYSFERLPFSLLKIKCAVTLGRCVAGRTIDIANSPHVSFVGGNTTVYEDYYRKGLLGGAFTDAHTPSDFSELKNTFQLSWLGKCLCGYDGMMRRSYIIVDKDNVVLDGAHRAALAFALTLGRLRHVEVIKMGISGRSVPSCPEIQNAPGLMQTAKVSSTGTEMSRRIEAYLEKLNRYGVRYVILRGGPLQTSKEHPDIDLLVDNYAQACALLNGTICGPRNIASQAVRVQGIYFDLRTTDDGYYPQKWAIDMLARRVRRKDGTYLLKSEDQLYALLYHAVLHKGSIGSGYLRRVQNFKTECTLTDDISTWLLCLERWIVPRYNFSESCHNCGGEKLLSMIHVKNTCGKCAKQSTDPNENFRATIVSAFYKTSTTKHTFSQYQGWMKNFFSMPDPLVVYVEDHELVSAILDMRKHASHRTIILPMQFEEFYTYNEFGGQKFWKTQVLKDSEAATHVDWRVYLIWLEKTTWLRSVSNLNPFNTDYFAWLDIGYIRQPIRLHGPLVKKVPPTGDDRIYLLNIVPFKQCQLETDAQGKIYFGKVSRRGVEASCQAIRTTAVNQTIDLHASKELIAGGAIYGSARAVERFREQFLATTRLYNSYSLFIGKDQYQMASVVVENPEDVVLVKPHENPRFKEDFGDPWFAFVPYLQGRLRD